jgi:SAM-dependent methyltransferase
MAGPASRILRDLQRMAALIRSAWFAILPPSRPFNDLILTTVVAVLLRAILALFAVKVKGPEHEVEIDAAIIAISFLVIERSRTWGFGRLVRNLGEIARVTEGSGRELIYALADRQLKEVAQLADSLRRDGFYASTTQESAYLFDILFAHGGFPYRGTDRHTPSAYYDNYEWFLSLHERSLTNSALSGAKDVRILTVSSAQLRNDFFRDPHSYLRFREWHQLNGVSLMHAEPDHAEVLSSKFAIGDADVGLWPEYAVLFYPSAKGGVTLGIRFPGDGQKPTYDQIRSYMDSLEASAKPIDDRDSGIDLFDQKLASAWAEYVDVDARMDPTGPVATMLRKELHGRKYVLDAAAGVGCESVLLVREGFSVESNEVDPYLAEQAKQLASKHGVTLRLSHHLWETMYSTMAGNFQFDSVLVLGNALSLVTDAERRRVCLASFWDVLSPGGILIVDERNYPRILSQREEIIENPLRSFRPATEGDVMFRGLDIRGYPAAISSDSVIWDFFLNGPGLRDDNPPSRRRLGTQLLELYPFKEGELLRLLKESGFERVRLYADLAWTADDIDTIPDDPHVRDADFLTYIAEKPRA